MTKRPFRVLGIQQIAVGGPDKNALARLWIELLGLERTGTYRNDKDNVDEDIAACGSGPFRVEVDLMQPLDPDGRPRVHEPPLNQVGLWIADLPAPVVGHDHDRGIVRVDPQIVHVTVGDRDGIEGPAAVHGPIQARVHGVDRVLVLGIRLQVHVVVGSLPKLPMLVHPGPGPTRVVRPVHATLGLGRLDERPDPVGVRW